jgi:hypothetical protein
MPSLINAFDPQDPAPDRPSASLLNRAPSIDAAQAPTPADAATFNVQAASDWIAQQRAISEARGLWGPDGPTPAGARDAGMQAAGALALATTGPVERPAGGFVAYHGSPHDFDAFDSSKIGTGEGYQTFGHGLYLADAEKTAQTYRDRLSDVNQFTNDQGPIVPKTAAEKTALAKFTELHADLGSPEEAMGRAYDYLKGAPLKALENWWSHGGITPDSAGHMYEVQVNADPARFLDWDKKVSQQPPEVQAALAPHVQNSINQGMTIGSDPLDFTGEEAYGAGQSVMPSFAYGPGGEDSSAAEMSATLNKAGIPGIRFLDAASRGSGTGTKNTVVFDPSILSIMRKYVVPAAMLSGTGHGLALGGSDSDSGDRTQQ